MTPYTVSARCTRAPLLPPRQANNEEAIRFYERHGFARGATVADYYKKLNPSDAVIMSRRIGAPGAAAS